MSQYNGEGEKQKSQEQIEDEMVKYREERFLEECESEYHYEEMYDEDRRIQENTINRLKSININNVELRSRLNNHTLGYINNITDIEFHNEPYYDDNFDLYGDETYIMINCDRTIISGTVIRSDRDTVCMNRGIIIRYINKNDECYIVDEGIINIINEYCNIHHVCSTKSARK